MKKSPASPFSLFLPRTVIGFVLLGLLAATPILHAKSPQSLLSATWLPGPGNAEGSQLAVNWRGVEDARLEVSLERPGQHATVLLAGQALNSGANLFPLTLAPDANGALQLSARDAAGTVLATWAGDLAQLRGASAFAWESRFVGPGLDNNVLVTTVWDDGSGPAVYAGGLFLSAGGNLVNRIARWNGSEWSPLGGPSDAGMNAQVLSLTVYDGALIAGGVFTEAGGVNANHIARWDGTAWSPLGEGTDGIVGTVQALTVYNGELIAGGGFTEAGGVTVNGIARWNGSQWSPLGIGVESGTVFSLAVFQGDLIVGGNFNVVGGLSVNHIASWDGSTWSPLGMGVTGGGGGFPTVYALTLYNDALIAAGSFLQAGGAPASLIARWDGKSWSALGSGMSGGSTLTVYALSVINGSLFAGGGFNQAGGQTANNIARWDGAAWSSLSGPSGIGTNNQVRALAGLKGVLIAGGVFTTAGGRGVNRVASWDGAAWAPLATAADAGMNGQVLALAVYEGALFAGGSFTLAGDLTVNHVARWDGSNWSALAGPTAIGISGGLAVVNAFGVFDGALIVGGSFTQAGGQVVNNIARWDGSTWSPLAGPSGIGMNDRIWALTLYGKQLIAAGAFTQAGGVIVNRIARWDGAAWSPLTGASGTGMDNTVYTLGVFKDGLIAGGMFLQAGGITVNRIARWDGTEWSGLTGASGTGVVDNRVQALAIYNGALIVGGGFTQAGGVTANWIAQWDGSEWSAFGTGLDTGCCAPWVRSLVVYDGSLFAGGVFENAGGVAVSHIARWDGTNWSPLSGSSGTGTSGGASGGAGDGSVAALVTFDADGPGPIPEKLVAGGNFSLTGGVPNWGIGLYGPAEQPFALTSAVSRAGGFDIDLPLTGAPGIECRNGRASHDYTIVFTFANPLTAVDSVSPGCGTVGSSMIDSADPHRFIVNLTGVGCDTQYITTTLSGVHDNLGNTLASVPVPWGLLVGDTNGDRVVNVGDTAGTTSHSGETVDASNFRFDVNEDGAINVGDAVIVRSKSGNALP